MRVRRYGSRRPKPSDLALATLWGRFRLRRMDALRSRLSPMEVRAAVRGYACGGRRSCRPASARPATVRTLRNSGSALTAIARGCLHGVPQRLKFEIP